MEDFFTRFIWRDMCNLFLGELIVRSFFDRLRFGEANDCLCVLSSKSKQGGKIGRKEEKWGYERENCISIDAYSAFD